jgi:hypothetical protein
MREIFWHGHRLPAGPQPQRRPPLALVMSGETKQICPYVLVEIGRTSWQGMDLLESDASSALATAALVVDGHIPDDVSSVSFRSSPFIEEGYTFPYNSALISPELEQFWPDLRS